MKSKRLRPTSFIARDLAATPITEGLLTELGFSLEQRDGNPRWVYLYHNGGGPLAPGIPMGYSDLELHASVLEMAFKIEAENKRGPFPKPVTILHLLLAAYIAGIHTGNAQAKGQIREALGI